MTNLFTGISREMKFVPDNQRSWLDFLMNNEGKRLIVEVERETGIRSMSQNSFMWMYLGVIEKEKGELATDLHEFFKRKFLPPIPKKILGVEFKIPTSTTTLNKSEFADYLDKICALTDVPIPVIPDKGETPVYPQENNEIKAF